MFPFSKFIFVLGPELSPPAASFIIFRAAERAEDVVRISGKIAHPYSYCQLSTCLIEVQYEKVFIAARDWRKQKGLGPAFRFV